ADVVAGRGDELGELVLEGVDGLHRLVDGQRGLGEPDDLGGVADLDLGDVLGAVDQLEGGGGLAGGADALLVALVPAQGDVVVRLGEADRCLVDLGDQRAGGVDGGEAAALGLLVDDGRHTVGGEHHDVARRDLLRLFDEDGALLLKGLHDVLVVHDLVPDVDGGPVLLEGLLDGDQGAVHTRAVTTGGGEQDTAARRSGHVSHRKGPAHGPTVTVRCRWRALLSRAWLSTRLRKLPSRSGRCRGSSAGGSTGWGRGGGRGRSPSCRGGPAGGGAC